MNKITSDQIRELRDKTGAPVIRVKKVLEEFKGDAQKALAVLQKEGFEKASKREARQTSQGIISSYVHYSQKLAVLVELLCETDFVARNDLFVELGKNIAMQIAAMNPKTTEELLEQDFINPQGFQASLIKDSSKKISNLIKETIVKTGENIKLGRFYRLELGRN